MAAIRAMYYRAMYYRESTHAVHIDLVYSSIDDEDRATYSVYRMVDDTSIVGAWMSAATATATDPSRS